MDTRREVSVKAYNRTTNSQWAIPTGHNCNSNIVCEGLGIVRHNFKKLDIVVSVIKEFPEAANDDPLLYAKYWEREGWDYSKGIYENLQKVTRPETITRRRRQAHDLGLVTYSEEADRERYKAYKNNPQCQRFKE